MIPGTLLYVYFGTVARNVNDILAGNNESGHLEGILIAVGKNFLRIFQKTKKSKKFIKIRTYFSLFFKNF